MLWKSVGVFGGVIKGKEENTKFDTNKNKKRQKYLIKPRNTKASLCAHHLKASTFLQD